MQLNWQSLVDLSGLNVDVWILVPTGLGVNRLLKKGGNISEAWLSKLEVFLGMKKKDIIDYFYQKQEVDTLFGKQIEITKETAAIEKSAVLYKAKLNKLFKFVSNAFVLKNKSNSVMFHFLMASNNKKAVKIANEIITKYEKIENGSISNRMDRNDVESYNGMF